MNTKKLSFTLIFILWTSSTPAQTISGIGAQKCQNFLQAVEQGTETAVDAYVAWSQGFISAFNWANARSANVQIDATGLLHWMIDYCNANPSSGFYIGVQESLRIHTQ